MHKAAVVTLRSRITGTSAARHKAPIRTVQICCMCGLSYHFNNLRFKHPIQFDDFPIPISNEF